MFYKQRAEFDCHDQYLSYKCFLFALQQSDTDDYDTEIDIDEILDLDELQEKRNFVQVYLFCEYHVVC